MNRKISLGITISLIAIGCAITFVLTWTVSLNIYNSKIASGEKFEGVYEKLQEMDRIVRGNYIGTVSDDTLEKSIINGYVSGIGDPYAYYLPPSSYYEQQQTTNGVVNGAGFEAEPDGSGYLVITRIYTGGSAETNGVQVGDVITEINNKSLLSMTTADAQESISGGTTGTKLSLRLVRDGELVSVTLIRQQIDIESVTYEMLENYIGYIRIITFNAKTSDQFSSALDHIKSRGAKALIIDVRQNGGGLVSALKPMLNRIISSAVVATAESGNVRRTLIETDSEEHLDIPIALLVDGGTASAAELFAVALRDEQGARLIGTQTYGKAVMQSTYEFSDGSAFTITTATIVPSKSKPYNGVGLKPDFVVELPAGMTPGQITKESDTQLLKALEILTPEITVPEQPEESSNQQ